MKKVTVLFSSLLFIFCLAWPVRAISSAEPIGLGALGIELEYGRQFQTPSSQTVLAKIVHGLSNQVDIKIMLGSFGIEKTGGFIYGAGIKWGLLQETHTRPAVSLNMEFMRGSYTTSDIVGAPHPIKIESGFFVPSILISKNLIWFTPYLEAGYDFADIKARDTVTGEVVSGLQGSSNTWFVGVGGVFEFDIIQLLTELVYDFDTPLGNGAFKAKAGFNLSL